MSDGARFDQIRKEVSDCVDVDNESRFTAQRVEGSHCPGHCRFGEISNRRTCVAVTFLCRFESRPLDAETMLVDCASRLSISTSIDAGLVVLRPHGRE